MKKYIKPTSPKKAQTNQPKKNEEKKIKKVVKESESSNRQKVYKSQKITPTKDNTIKELFIRKNDTPKERKHPEYGTSKLEERFANKFLKKLGVTYEYQFKAESIGRYFDFYIKDANLLIEIDGDYYHGYGLLREEMSPMQKKSNRIDKDKDKWAKFHKIPLIRFWEHEINNTPKEVFEKLKEKITYYTELNKKELEKKKRPTKK